MKINRLCFEGIPHDLQSNTASGLILMDEFQCVCWVVETNGLSLLSFLPHFQPDPFLFPLSLPFRPSSSPTLSRVGFLQSSGRVLPSVACALTLFHGSGSEGSEAHTGSRGRIALLPDWMSYRLTDWLLTWQLGEENRAVPLQEDWQRTEQATCWIL